MPLTGATYEVRTMAYDRPSVIDIVFYPDVGAIDRLQALGLMGRIRSQPSLVEAFRNASLEWEILNCRDKSVTNPLTCVPNSAAKLNPANSASGKLMNQ
jgi:hypothetical protein